MKFIQFLKVLFILPCILLCAIVLVISWKTSGTVLTYISNVPSRDIKTVTLTLEERLSNNLAYKFDFINLNGALTNILGINSINDTYKLADSSLADIVYADQNNAILAADSFSLLKDFLDEQGIGLLCVPHPRKLQYQDLTLSPGYESLHSSDIFSFFMSELKARDIPVVDMEAWYKSNGWGSDDVFFRTDHHWKPEAAFAAMQQIMYAFSENNGITLDLEMLNPDNWQTDIYENSFLGYLGRRTGRYYAGLDDFSFIYPKFPVDLRVDRLTAARELDIARENTLYFPEYLNNPDLFNVSPYYVYLGGDYPYTVIRNSQAVNDKKLLVLGDSYRVPLECFLFTQFSEIYHVDMRAYEDGTFAQCVQQISPDLVLLAFNSLPFFAEELGLEEWYASFHEKEPGTPLAKASEISLSPSTSTSQYYLLASNLEPGAYALTIGDALLQRALREDTSSPGGFVQFALLDLKSNTSQAARYFLANYDQPQKWFFTVPENPDASYVVVVYNGTDGYTAGNTTCVLDLLLTPYR